MDIDEKLARRLANSEIIDERPGFVKLRRKATIKEPAPGFWGARTVPGSAVFFQKGSDDKYGVTRVVFGDVEHSGIEFAKELLEDLVGYVGRYPMESLEKFKISHYVESVIII